VFFCWRAVDFIVTVVIRKITGHTIKAVHGSYNKPSRFSGVSGKMRLTSPLASQRCGGLQWLNGVAGGDKVKLVELEPFLK